MYTYNNWKFLSITALSNISQHTLLEIKEVRIRLNIKTDLMQTIMKRKLGLFGHICRMENSRKIKSVMLGIMDGKGRRGRPNMEWIDNRVDRMVQQRSVQLDYICTRPKTLETND